MGKQARLILIGTVIMVTCIMIPMIDSTTIFYKNVTSLLDGDNVSGRHVDACCNMIGGYLNWERNETGHTISKNGFSIEMMDWLSLSMKFEYECIPQKDSERFTRDNETNKDTLTSLYKLKHGDYPNCWHVVIVTFCDITPMPYLFTYARFKEYCDFLSPFLNMPFDLLIPLPQLSIGGISSVWKPFETSVWTALLVSIAITLILSLVNWLYDKSRIGNDARNGVSLDIHWLFLFGLLMSKAGFRAPNSFKMRLAGGAWCIAALILTNFYSSVLTSLITASSPVPIVNSVEEMANNDNVELVIVKGFGASAKIADGKDTNILFKKLDKKLKSSPNAFCPNQSACFDQVVAKKTTTFLHDKPSLYALVSEDYRRTGKCNVAFAKESFSSVTGGWAVPKNYLQFEKFQRGLLRMIETGLVDHWKDIYLPKPIECMVDPSSRQVKMADIRNPALVNLHSLVPAFLFLFVGFIIASTVILAEWIKKL